jgi:hypothetical protein
VLHLALEFTESSLRLHKKAEAKLVVG